jgi:hypothetical protein
MSNAMQAAVAVVAGIIGLAIVAVLVSRNSQTGSVITSAGTALSGLIGAATAPVAGNSLANSFGVGR